jgi:hypothetical protein
VKSSISTLPSTFKRGFARQNPADPSARFGRLPASVSDHRLAISPRRSTKIQPALDDLIRRCVHRLPKSLVSDTGDYKAGDRNCTISIPD